MMAVVSNRRSVMTLFSRPTDIHSHRTRLVLAEKNINIEIANVPGPDLPEDLMDLNPYHTVPTLVDRDLTLYDSRVIVEYLDERFPHPPLMPVDPISRAKTRLMISRLTRDWLKPIRELGELAPFKISARLKKDIHDGLVAFSPLFRDQPFFLGLEYTLVDAYMAPLIWRLPALGIELPKQAAPVSEYGSRLFKRQAFQESLSPQEAELRDL